MNENIRIPDVPAAEVTSKAEIAQAADIILAMVKASKGSKLYTANNSLLEKFYQDLADKMAAHQELYGEYRLEVERFELRYKGHVVYDNADTAESMAYRLYSDGIRSFVFSQGIEEWEMREFLTIVNTRSSADLDDDIVTLLWDRGLPHCLYILEDDYQEADSTQYDELVGNARAGEIPASCLADPLSCAARVQRVPPQLYTLSAEDSALLQALLEDDEKIRPLDEVGRILSAILCGAADTGIFSSILEISLKMVRNLFAAEESASALQMFSFLYNQTLVKEPSAERKQIALQSLGRFWTENAFKGLCTVINTTDAISAEQLKTLSFMISRTSFSTICELLGSVEKMPMRKILIEVILEKARENPHLLVPYLADPRWYLVRNMVFMLAQLKDATLLEQMAPLISHRDQRVRKEVLKYLITVDEPKSKPYILKFLRDDSAALSVMAVQFFGRSRLQFALKPIAALVETYEFDIMDVADKKTVYEVIGVLGGTKMLPMFKELLLKKFMLTTPKEMESVVCAIAGLLKVPGEESVKILHEGLRLKRSEFRDVISKAISLASATAAPSPD